MEKNRDIGPYTSAEQTMDQFNGWAAGMPLSRDLLAEVCLKEALLSTKVALPRFELDVLENAGPWDPQVVQVVAGWIYRAYENGRCSR